MKSWGWKHGGKEETEEGAVIGSGLRSRVMACGFSEV